jgi:hypothetical protein
VLATQRDFVLLFCAFQASTAKANHSLSLSLSERRKAFEELFAEFRETDAQEKAVKKLATAKKQASHKHMWRIGRLHVADVALQLKGHTAHLSPNGWMLHAFVGDTQKLKRKVAKGIA